MLFITSVALFVIGLVLLVALVFRRRQLHEALVWQQQQQKILRAIAEDQPLTETLEQLCEHLEGVLPGSTSTVMVTNDDGHSLALKTASRLPAAYRDQIKRIPIGEGVGACGTAAALRQPVIIPDVQREPACEAFQVALDAAGLSACWAYPLVSHEGQVLGTLTLYFARVREPRHKEQQKITALLDLAVLALARAKDKQQLAYSEQHYRSLFTHNPDGVFSLDLQGRFQQINQEACDILGQAEEDVLGQHYETVVLPQDINRTREHFEAGKKGQAQRYRIQVFHKSGRPVWLDITNMPVIIDGEIKGVYGQAKDITRRVLDEEQLQILKRGIEASRNGIVVADARQPGNPLIYVNPAFEKITGYERADVLGYNCSFLQGENTDHRAVEQIRSRLKKHKEVHVALLNYRKDGQTFWNDLYISPVRDSQGELTHYIGVQNDISERKQQEEQLAYHATHDMLTGLPNRTLLVDRLHQAVSRTRREEDLLAVLFLDMDGFKPVNDSLGHRLGDDILKEVAQRLQAELRDSDTVGRFGGDEFIIILPAAGTTVDIEQVTRRLLKRLSRSYRVAGHQISLTASIGITTSDGHHQNPEELIQQADMAMYKAKRQGHNHLQWFSQDITAKVSRQVALRNELSEALERQDFMLYYQPVLDATGKVIAIESLLRWQHQELGFMAPGEFIPVAEHTGQIIPLSDWVIQQACADAQHLPDHIRVAVNLSPVQFHRTNFVTDLLNRVAETGMPIARLSLELTENVLMDETEAAVRSLQTLRKAGAYVAIDDFGTGYSSLSYLRDLPVDAIKMDRSFVQEVTSSDKRAAIVRGMIAMARELQLKVVAEGVETAAEFELLKQFGCHAFQGFYLARPMPFADLQQFLQEQQKVS